MNPNIKFEYSNNTAICTIKYKGYEFIGKAFCHPDDMDYESERTGLCIAEARANIKVMKFKRNCEIKPAVGAMKHLVSNIKMSNKCNEKSNELRLIYSNLNRLEKQLDTINNDIAEEEQYLKEYIQKKDEFYKKLRARNK